MGRRHRISAQQGFTIVEVMVAMVVLIVGLAGTMTLLDKAQATTVSNKAREGAIAVSRELVEAARGPAYDKLTQGNVVSQIRTTPGFTGSTVTGDGWQVQSRGITYTLAVGVCSVDDPNDGYGAVDSTFCAGNGTTTSAACASALGRTGSISGTGSASGVTVGDCGIDLDKDGQVDDLTLGDTGACTSGTCTGAGTSNPPDQNPDDYKRVVTLVRWTVGNGSHYVLESTSLPYPGLSGAPRVTSLTPSSLNVTSPTVTTIGATVVTNRKAAGVTWLVDGTPNGNATSSDGINWAFIWDLRSTGCNVSAAAPLSGEVIDGAYLLGAKATDTFSQAGPTRTQTITLNRCKPYAPTGLVVAHVGNTVEAVWGANPERDIEGYALYRVQGTGTPQVVCDVSRNRTCTESSPPSSGAWDYYVAAFDKDPSTSALRAGLSSSKVSIDLSNSAPYAPAGTPTGVRVSTSSTSISWTASPGDPDSGDSVTAYRIYRDGTTLNDRYATVPAGTYSYTDALAPDGHTYYVAAVDSHGAESVKSPGVDVP
ncbi:MAG: prepilin-type N-terminal cleavage/methylation domain-containing protein [Actinomycetes bacterium]